MTLARKIAASGALSILLAAAGHRAVAQEEDEAPSPPPAGAAKTGRTKALEAGTRVLQDLTPVEQISTYLVGYHPMKDDPTHQMEAHHYCHQVNQDFAQCVLYDGNTDKANLIGIEYIISEKTFETLAAEERQYWHPHNFEILSGQLIAPSLPRAAETAAMRDKMNSYGKTWHVWSSKEFGKPQGDKLPLGEPMLMWSFNADGEAKPGLMKARDEAFGVSTAEIRKARQELVPLAHPQEGVDALADKLGANRSKPKGVETKASKTAH